MNISVVLSGGTGARFGGEIPKQYYEVCGKELISYVINAVTKCQANHKTIIVAAPDYIPRLSTDYGLECVFSGEQHNHSVKNALDYIKTHYSQCKKVLFVDAPRPFITSSDIQKYFDILDEVDAVFTAKHITDSLGNANSLYIERSPYYLIQKPEGFVFDVLYDHFIIESPVTAIVQQMPQGAKVAKHYITDINLKITYPGDLILAQSLMEHHLREES